MPLAADVPSPCSTPHPRNHAKSTPAARVRMLARARRMARERRSGVRACPFFLDGEAEFERSRAYGGLTAMHANESGPEGFSITFWPAGVCIGERGGARTRGHRIKSSILRNAICCNYLQCKDRLCSQLQCAAARNRSLLYKVLYRRFPRMAHTSTQRVAGLPYAKWGGSLMRQLLRRSRDELITMALLCKRSEAFLRPVWVLRPTA